MSLMKHMRGTIAAALVAVVTASAVLPFAVMAQTPPAAPAPPAPAAVAIAPVAGPIAPPEAVVSPYGLEAMWKQGDMVAKVTLIILIIMSVGSWYIIFSKVFEQRKLIKSGVAASKSFWTAGSVKDGVTGLDKGSAFRFIAESGVSASEHHVGTLVEQIDLHTWISMSIQRSVDNVHNRLQDGMAFLATVGSTAPFVGLFGTVWGIYHALVAIGTSGQASIDKVAGPVGEALIMTAIGLAVAVPAVMGYNWLLRRNKEAMDQVRSFGGDVVNVLLAAKR